MWNCIDNSGQQSSCERKCASSVLPTEGPRIIGGLPKYRVGDTVSVNCTSSSSKPAATLNWYINDEIITGKKESGYQTEHFTVHHSNGLESSSLSLKFVVREHHFRGGNMKLKCTATISRVYTMSNEELVFRQQNSGLHILENASRVRNSCSRLVCSNFLQIAAIYFLLKTFTEILVYSLRTTKSDNLAV
ncbi:hypothetical protein AVEN_146187-1 [Araneus ventricosus]|uniref:Ig-like domain-containing protein n=1 Tax=Araneus ventricosus TaxID=182803 RepID=A0A4Y2CJF6_ARAVE|nr:hypothetical protein AVEN_146187-1 [Araneus ventricosus]